MNVQAHSLSKINNNKLVPIVKKINTINNTMVIIISVKISPNNEVKSQKQEGHII